MRPPSVPIASLAAALLVAGCATAQPAATASPSAAATTSPTEAATESAAPTLAATTVEATEAPPGAISITMVFGPRFEPDEVTAGAGTVSFFLRSDPAGDAFHNMNIGREEGSPLASSSMIPNGHGAVFTVEGLTPGTYAFWCTYNDHAFLGMVGTLTVTE